LKIIIEVKGLSKEAEDFLRNEPTIREKIWSDIRWTIARALMIDKLPLNVRIEVYMKNES